MKKYIFTTILIVPGIMFAAECSDIADNIDKLKRDYDTYGVVAAELQEQYYEDIEASKERYKGYAQTNASIERRKSVIYNAFSKKYNSTIAKRQVAASKHKQMLGTYKKCLQDEQEASRVVISTIKSYKITDNSAKVEGVVSRGTDVTTWFVYGTSKVQCATAQKRVPVKKSRDKGDSLVATIEKLNDDRVYYYRACGSRSGETYEGKIKTFTTKKSPAPKQPKIVQPAVTPEKTIALAEQEIHTTENTDLSIETERLLNDLLLQAEAQIEQKSQTQPAPVSNKKIVTPIIITEAVSPQVTVDTPETVESQVPVQTEVVTNAPVTRASNGIRAKIRQWFSGWF